MSMSSVTAREKDFAELRIKHQHLFYTLYGGSIRIRDLISQARHQRAGFICA